MGGTEEDGADNKCRPGRVNSKYGTQQLWQEREKRGSLPLFISPCYRWLKFRRTLHSTRHTTMLQKEFLTKNSHFVSFCLVWEKWIGPTSLVQTAISCHLLDGLERFVFIVHKIHCIVYKVNMSKIYWYKNVVQKTIIFSRWFLITSVILQLNECQWLLLC